ncbi:MAG: hypothetical protein LC799_31245 [Actinobacteria bacterium]|nr:hypothetical protein [Actinomycetota bacterium]
MTANLRHFPPHACDPHSICVESPDRFLCAAYQRGPDAVPAVLRAQAARKRCPVMSIDEMLDRLAIVAPGFVTSVRSAVNVAGQRSVTILTAGLRRKVCSQVRSSAVTHPAAQALDCLVGGQAEAEQRGGKL